MTQSVNDGEVSRAYALLFGLQPDVVKALRAVVELSPEQLKHQYRKRAGALHPDKNSGVPPSVANEQFSALVASYELLVDLQKTSMFMSRARARLKNASSDLKEKNGDSKSARIPSQRMSVINDAEIRGMRAKMPIDAASDTEGITQKASDYAPDEVTARRKRPSAALSEYLYREGLITRYQFSELLNWQRKNSLTHEQLLLDWKLINRSQLAMLRKVAEERLNRGKSTSDICLELEIITPLEHRASAGRMRLENNRLVELLVRAGVLSSRSGHAVLQNFYDQLRGPESNFYTAQGQTKN